MYYRTIVLKARKKNNYFDINGDYLLIFYLYHEINYGGNVLERGASVFELFRSIRLTLSQTTNFTLAN